MRTLNFYDSLTLGREELIQQNSFLREELALFLNKAGNGFKGGRGALRILGSLSNEFAVSKSMQAGKINVNAGYGVGVVVHTDKDPLVPTNLNGVMNSAFHSPDIKDGEYSVVFKCTDQINIPIPNFGSLPNVKLYVMVNPYITIFEPGTCNVNTSGNVVFTDPGVVKKLRGHLSNSPTKICFYADSDAITSYNNMEYEVISVDGVDTVTVSGDIGAALSGYKCAIIGSYDLMQQPFLQNRFLYASVDGRIGFEANPLSTLHGGFPVAVLEFDADGTTYTVTDIRDEYLFKFQQQIPTIFGEWTDMLPFVGNEIGTAAEVISLYGRTNITGDLEFNGAINVKEEGALWFMYIFNLNPSNPLFDFYQTGKVTNFLLTPEAEVSEMMGANAITRNGYEGLDRGGVRGKFHGMGSFSVFCPSFLTRTPPGNPRNPNYVEPIGVSGELLNPIYIGDTSAGYRGVWNFRFTLIRGDI